MGHGFYFICYQFHCLVIRNAGYLINQAVHILNFQGQFLQLLFLPGKFFFLLHQDIILLFQIRSTAIRRFPFKMQTMLLRNLKQQFPTDCIKSLFPVIVFSFWLIWMGKRYPQFLQRFFLLGTQLSILIFCIKHMALLNMGSSLIHVQRPVQNVNMRAKPFFKFLTEFHNYL